MLLAIPTATNNANLANLGVLKFTWSSEHYSETQIKDEISKNKFEIIESKNIGKNVYVPLANYYFDHRKELQEKIKTKYSSATEKILYRSLKKMLDSSESGLIDYVFLKCK